MCRNESACVAACLPFPIVSGGPETGPVNGVNCFTWLQNSGRQFGILKRCRNPVLKGRTRGMQKMALPGSQGIQGTRQSEAGEMQGHRSGDQLGLPTALCCPHRSYFHLSRSQGWRELDLCALCRSQKLHSTVAKTWPAEWWSVPDTHTRGQSVWCLHLFLAHCSVYIIALSLCLAHLKQSLLFFLSPNNAENFTLFILYGSISTL